MTEREHMLTSILKCRRADLYSRPLVLTPHQEATLASMIKRRESGEPLQYILGNWGFMSCTIKVSPSVLIPRPETELLVEHAIQRIRKRYMRSEISILDVGTGSGCIAIALAKEFPDAKVTALDISTEAAEIARDNAQANGVAERVDVLAVDVFGYLNIGNYCNPPAFDVIISNPPYIRSAAISSLQTEVQKEPKIALDGGEDGLKFYRYIIETAPDFLIPRGLIFFELGDDQAAAVVRLLDDQVWGGVERAKDYRGFERIVSAELKS